MKEKGFIEKIVTAGIVAAGIGGTLYLLKDKIEENPKYKEAVDKAKDKIKQFTAPDISEEDFVGFDDVDDFNEILHSDSERGYVKIKLHEEDAFDSEADDVVADYSEAE